MFLKALAHDRCLGVEDRPLSLTQMSPSLSASLKLWLTALLTCEQDTVADLSQFLVWESSDSFFILMLALEVDSFKNVLIPPNLLNLQTKMYSLYSLIILLVSLRPLVVSLILFLTLKFFIFSVFSWSVPGVSNVSPMGYVQPRTAVNGAQHKILTSLKTLWDLFVCLITCHNVFNVRPKATPLLPVRRRDTKRSDTPCRHSQDSIGLPVSRKVKILGRSQC